MYFQYEFQFQIISFLANLAVNINIDRSVSYRISTLLRVEIMYIILIET